LFPPLPADEFEALAQDIAANGQWEAIRLYEGKILDGVNRLRACRRASEIKGQEVEPWIEEFDPKKAKMSAEQFVITRNLRRRHLTTGQRAVVAVEWAEKAEREGFLTHVAKMPGEAGRPRSSALPEISVLVGTTEQRAREAKRIRDANPALFAELKAGSVSLKSALAEVQPPPAEVAWRAEGVATEADEVAEIRPADQAEDDEPVVAPIFAPPSMAIPQPAIKPSPRLSRKERIAGAWNDVERVFGGGKYTKWLRDGRLTDDEALEFEKLASDADKKQVRRVMLQNRSFREAVDSLTGLNPQNTIQDLHTRAIQSSGGYVGQIGEFLHVVAFGEKGRAELLERLADWPTK
jgi:hypothetical protein